MEITITTLSPQPGDTVFTWSSMTIDRPTPPRWTMNGATWEFLGYTRFAGSNFKTYFFGAIEKPARDEYSAEWLDALERAA